MYTARMLSDEHNQMFKCGTRRNWTCCDPFRSSRSSNGGHSNAHVLRRRLQRRIEDRQWREYELENNW